MPGGNIFLNYRREDTEGYARLIQKSLEERFPGCVFRDVSGIAPGANFVREIERKLETCHVLLVLIGKDWLTVKNAQGVRRLDDARDFVRLEIATGLRRGVPVIPVLVEGARMPEEGDLPDDLRPLSQHQAVTIIDRSDDDDFRPLFRVLERMFGVPAPRPAPPPTYTPDASPSPWKTLALVTSLGLGALAVLFVVLGVLYGGRPTPSGNVAGSLVSNSTAPGRQPSATPPGGAAAGPKRTPASPPSAKTPPAAAPPAGDAPGGDAPAPGAGARPAEFTGRWLLNDRHETDESTVVTLAPDSGFAFQSGSVSFGGAWYYEEAERRLILVTRASGALNTIILTLGEKPGDHYHATMQTTNAATGAGTSAPVDMRRG